jgi:drug/metabolite transporter (DMT)-like permease
MGKARLLTEYLQGAIRFSAKAKIMDTGSKNQIKGYLSVVVASIMWATSGTAGKALFEAGMTPFELVQIRVTLSTAILTALLAASSKGLPRIKIKDLGTFLLIGAVFMAMVQGTYFFAISKIEVAAAILLQDLAVVLVAIFSICFWKERLTTSKLIALIMALCGCFMVVGGYNLDMIGMNRMGIMGGLASAVCLAGYALVGEGAMHRYTPATILFYALAFSSLTWHIIYPPFHYVSAGFTPSQWGWILYIAVVGTIIPFGLFFVGINYIRSTRAIITATLEPISGGFMAFFLLGEILEPLQVIGGGLVVGGIVLLQIKREQDEMTPDFLRSRGK